MGEKVPGLLICSLSIVLEVIQRGKGENQSRGWKCQRPRASTEASFQFAVIRKSRIVGTSNTIAS